MKILILLLSMIFFHIVDDYYLQGWLASAKQRSWWEKNAADDLYKNDYIMALMEHAFSWTFMIHIPIVAAGSGIPLSMLLLTFAINWSIHAIVDDLKANKKVINLIQDQSIHLVQIILTWGIYVFGGII
jgi:hypothetical protein